MKVKIINRKFFKKLAASRQKITLSTWFTLARIALTPFVIAGMVMHAWGLAFIFFVLASVTDIIDGNLARLRNEKTALGACLDPVADKFLILSTYFTLAFVQSPLFSIPAWFVSLVLFKELLLIAGAALIYGIRGRLHIEPTLLGKVTMFIQICFIIWLFACYFFNWVPIRTYYCMLGILLMLVFSCLVQYTRIALGQFGLRILN